MKLNTEGPDNKFTLGEFKTETAGILPNNIISSMIDFSTLLYNLHLCASLNGKIDSNLLYIAHSELKLQKLVAVIILSSAMYDPRKLVRVRHKTKVFHP